MVTHHDDPLHGVVPEEVPLKDAPLLRVLAQVRFPEILAVEQREFVAPFQEAIRVKYPVLRQEQAQGVVFTNAGLVAPIKPQTAWRFSDVANEWRVSLTPEFLTLETMKYTSRKDFLSRLKIVLEALDEHVEPKLVDRLGVRYIDRLSGDDVTNIAKLVRPEVCGIGGLSFARDAAHGVTETLFDVDGAQILARWASLPPNKTIDAATIEPVDMRTWILDLDMFGATPGPFGVDRLVRDTERYMERIYAVFRWAVTEEFLRRFGGKL